MKMQINSALNTQNSKLLKGDCSFNSKLKTQHSTLLIRASGLQKSYFIKKGFFATSSHEVRAVRNVDLEIKEGEILGLVGESGSGKSTLARLLLGLEPPTKGEVWFQGRSLWGKAKGSRISKEFRRTSQMIFQDPVSSLNPKKTVYETLREPLLIHGLCDKSRLEAEVVSLLKEVGLGPAFLDRYPHELSGGQKQRIGIARALSTRPSFIICDEPTSALDVSIQAQIINLILDLHERHCLTILFISHAIPIVKFVSDKIAVMYRGVIVEIFPSDATPLHPYTRLLMKAVPKVTIPITKNSKLKTQNLDRTLECQPSDFSDVQLGSKLSHDACPFFERCRVRKGECKSVSPVLREIGPGHFVACINPYDA
ncbi:Oligopeptide transport ATP-binding protein OppF [Dissulfuribacter thermophilus]|uniref:Oligopeptide transport ATP-binding protein OppF n=1 Tax=Dissulfuribacter thermophilus TaxID=1156395 RepID=A0A1B9F7V1_9BACT|nr:oligopeptide/dipeptide ABC transporter ATP-binding protein [Dissulfuribacter thermophilus]OCC15924.1 Oligopeptide transport ATP-binding protein OppF [Dissulfuribacter thermophilus]